MAGVGGSSALLFRTVACRASLRGFGVPGLRPGGTPALHDGCQGGPSSPAVLADEQACSLLAHVAAAPLLGSLGTQVPVSHPSCRLRAVTCGLCIWALSLTHVTSGGQEQGAGRRAGFPGAFPIPRLLACCLPPEIMSNAQACVPFQPRQPFCHILLFEPHATATAKACVVPSSLTETQSKCTWYTVTKGALTLVHKIKTLSSRSQVYAPHVLTLNYFRFYSLFLAPPAGLMPWPTHAS